MALLRILFIIICVLWLLKMVARLLLPVLFQKIVTKAQQQANQQTQKRNTPPDGRIRVDYIPPREKETKADKVGDFVEYEEIKATNS